MVVGRIALPRVSNAAITVACPGWWQLYQLRKVYNAKSSRTNKYAANGVEAHKLYLDAVSTCYSGWDINDLYRRYCNEGWFSADMYNDALKLGEIIAADARDNNAYPFYDERVDLDAYIEGWYGYADVVLYDKSCKYLHVIDVKTGHETVDAMEQLVCYAAGLVTADTATVKLSIWQHGKMSTVTYTRDELLAKMDVIVDSMHAALAGNAERKAGKHCRWCPAKAYCDTCKRWAVDDMLAMRNNTAIRDVEYIYRVLTAAGIQRDAHEILVNSADGELAGYVSYERKGDRYVKDVDKLAGILHVDISELLCPMGVKELIKRYGKATIDAMPADVIARKPGRRELQRK